MVSFNWLCSVCVVAAVSVHFADGQGTVPTFRHADGGTSYRLLGRDPARGGTTTIPTVLAPIALVFEAQKVSVDANADVSALVRSPVFGKFSFPIGGTTQYGDAMLRAAFPNSEGWHTLLGKPEVKPVRIAVPVGDGYVLRSKRTGGLMAVVDVQFLQRALFQKIPKQEGRLVIAVTHNTTFYADGDATVCCSWGAHGVDPATQNSFVLGSLSERRAGGGARQ